MSSRVHPKAAKRQVRLRKEEEWRQAAERSRNRSRLAIVAIAAVAIAANAVSLTRPQADPPGRAPPL